MDTSHGSYFTGSFWTTQPIVLAAKATLGRSTLHNNKEAEIAFPERSRMQEPIFYCDGVFKLVPRLYKYMNILRDYIEK
jgi:hypothetical protein